MRGSGVKDIVWLTARRQRDDGEDWSNDIARCLGVFLGGEALQRGRRARPARCVDDDFLLLFNAHHEPIAFELPDARSRRLAGTCVDTALGNGLAAASGD